MLAINARGSIGFYSGDTSKLEDEASTLRPTIFFAVPRIFQRIRQRTYQSASGSDTNQRLLETAISEKLKSVNK